MSFGGEWLVRMYRVCNARKNKPAFYEYMRGVSELCKLKDQEDYSLLLY